MKLLLSFGYCAKMYPKEREKMSKKKSKTEKIGVITSQQIFDAQKPKWNGWSCGDGAHGDRKYNRRKAEREFRRDYL